MAELAFPQYFRLNGMEFKWLDEHNYIKSYHSFSEFFYAGVSHAYMISTFGEWINANNPTPISLTEYEKNLSIAFEHISKKAGYSPDPRPQD